MKALCIIGTFLCLLMLLVSPGIANSATPATLPPTNTAIPRTAVALVPSLTAIACPTEQSYSFVDSAGVVWNVEMKPLCR